jgi:hypothetical protein
VLINRDLFDFKNISNIINFRFFNTADNSSQKFGPTLPQYKLNNDAYSEKEKQNKITQSKYDILLLHKPFSCFYKGNHGQTEDIYTDLK